jgi:hypothetical protein
MRLILVLMYVEIKDAIHRWELRNINPMSPFVHEIVHKRRKLADLRKMATPHRAAPGN